MFDFISVRSYRFAYRENYVSLFSRPSPRPDKVVYEQARSVPWRSYEAKSLKQMEEEEGIWIINFIQLTSNIIGMSYDSNSDLYVYVLLRLRVQNRRKKWNFPLNFRTMHKLSELYSGIFQNYWLFNHLDVHLVWTTSETLQKLKNLNF